MNPFLQWRLASLPPVVMLLVLAGCTKRSTSADSVAARSQSPANNRSTDSESDLENRLRAIADRAQGQVGITITHIETGKTVSINGQSRLPLYSVFKLPLAVAVLKDVEENRLRLDQRVHVTPADIVPGTPENTKLWEQPVDKTIPELIEVSIALSDNTSSDKLLQLAGGPGGVTQRMRSLGFENLDIHSTVNEFAKTLTNPNTGSSDDLASLLAQLHQGKILQPANTDLLIGFMRKATTGLRRLRADLPSGTLVADKTGSGEKSSVTGFAKATNDVGIITLPNGRGNLAVAVLFSESKLPNAQQEKVIAEVARTAYDQWAVGSGK